jgi:hypothetical protein
MGQLTAEERRRIFLNRQLTDRDMRRRISESVAASERLPVRRGLGRMLEITLLAALLSAGWLASHAVAFQVPASLSELLPRL